MNKYSAIQGHEYIVLGPIWPFDYTILIYNIRVHEADVIVPPSSAFLHLHPIHDTKQKREWENIEVVELEYRNERKHLRNKCTGKGLV
jgi:hypothetical protein